MTPADFEATRKLVQLAVATQMVRNGTVRTTFSRRDMEEVEDNYTVKTEYDAIRGWTITVRPKTPYPGD